MVAFTSTYPRRGKARAGVPPTDGPRRWFIQWVVMSMMLVATYECVASLNVSGAKIKRGTAAVAFALCVWREKQTIK